MHDRRSIAAFTPRVPRRARTILAAMLGIGLAAQAGCGQARLPGDGEDSDAGNGGPDGMQPGPGGPLGSSFEISAVLTYDASQFPFPPDFLPDEHAFVLRLDDTGFTTQALAGVAGEAVTGNFTRLASGALSLDSELSLPGTGGAFTCTFGRVAYDDMTLTTFDDDGDGVLDRVEGTATGAVGRIGDVIAGNEFTAVIRGIRDLTPPRLTLVGPSADRSVLGDFVVEASEPLRPGLDVTVVSSAGERVSLTPVPGEGESVVSFVAPDDLLLPFGGSIQLEVEPAAEDLAGNRGTLETPGFGTIADPGAFPQDGFESQSSVTLSGNAEMVAGVGTVAAIAGVTSLLLEPGSSATLRVPVPDAGATSLTLQLRGLFPDVEDRDLGGEVVIVAPGAAEHVRASFPDAIGETVATTHADWAFAGAVALLSVPLPANTTGELIVVLRILSPETCSGQSAPDAAVLIDSVSAQ